MKILVTRTDRLGDLVLSLPVFTYLHRVRPDWRLHAMVAPAAVPLVEHHPQVEAVWTWAADGGSAADEDLIARLRGEGFDAALMLQYRRELARLLKRAGIGRRYGPWSKGSSWFLLNRGTWQARSRGKRHEMEYNLDLAWRLARDDRGAVPRPGGDRDDEPRLHLSDGQREIGRRFRADRAAGAAVVAFLHPGSGGSALDWEPERFAGVANALASQPGWRVFLTGADGDRNMVRRVETYLDPQVESLLGKYPLRDFLGILAGGDLLIGPSTGPLHLAAALGLATVGLYPPVATMSPRRWGQQGRWSVALVPDLSCPESRVCVLERCRLYNCLTAIYERDVIAAAVRQVEARAAALAAATTERGGRAVRGRGRPSEERRVDHDEAQ